MEKMPGVVDGEVSARNLRLAVIVSRYNTFITERLLDGAVEALKSREAIDDNIVVFRVPGSFELPQAARKAAEKGEFDAIICLGALIRGATLHFELISEECARGIQQVAADFTLPVAFGVITADTMEQAMERAGEKSENKGWEAAITAVEMANLFRKMDEKDL